MWMAGCVCIIYLGEEMAPRCTMGRRQTGIGSVMICAMFCWGTLGGCYFDTPHLNIVVDQVHPFIATIFPDGSGFFQQNNVPYHTAKIVHDGLRSMTKSCVDLVSIFPRSQSNWAYVHCAGKTTQIHGGPTSQLTGLKGSAANILVPDTTGHRHRSCAHALKHWSCSGEWAELCFEGLAVDIAAVAINIQIPYTEVAKTPQSYDLLHYWKCPKS